MQKNTEFSEWQLLDELNIFFNYNLVQMNEWLDTPIPRLEGQCPRILLLTDENRKELFQLLQEMKFGDIA